jgi:hypothetical protein
MPFRRIAGCIDDRIDTKPEAFASRAGNMTHAVQTPAMMSVFFRLSDRFDEHALSHAFKFLGAAYRQHAARAAISGMSGPLN